MKETKRVREIVKRGEWVYDGAVPCELRVVMTNFFEHPGPEDDEKVAGYPPRDENGNFYVVEYLMKGRVRGVSNCFGSLEDAVKEATGKLESPIRWM